MINQPSVFFFFSAEAELKENDGRTKVAYNVYFCNKLE